MVCGSNFQVVLLDFNSTILRCPCHGRWKKGCRQGFAQGGEWAAPFFGGGEETAAAGAIGGGEIELVSGELQHLTGR